MAGRAAEIVVFGNKEITQCASNDIIYSTGIAREMVTKFGFSVMGPIAINNSDELILDNSLLKKKAMIADKTSSTIDTEVIKISKTALDRSISIIKKNKLLLDKLVEVLIVEETIDKIRFKDICKDSLKV